MGTKEEIAAKAIPVKIGDVLRLEVEEPHAQNPKDGIARVEGYVIDIKDAGSRVGETVHVKITSCLRTFAKGIIVNSQDCQTGSQVSD